jgi:hypothetical protein
VPHPGGAERCAWPRSAAGRRDPTAAPRARSPRGGRSRQEVAHHHPVQTCLDRRGLQLAQVLHPPAAEPEQRLRQDQAKDGDPFDDLPGVHQLTVTKLRPWPRVEQVDGHAGRVDRGELEGHLNSLLARLAEVEDAPHAGLQAGLADGIDRAQPALVADGGRDLGVVGLGRLDVVMHALDAGLPERLGASHRHVPDRCAALEVRVLGDQTRPLEHLLEVAFGQALALGHHAETVRAGRLGGPRMLEDLLGLHHRVQRRLGLGVLALGAEPAVLGAAARLGVDQRAHVGRVAETLNPCGPGALDQRFNLGVVFQLAEAQGLLMRDQGEHRVQTLERGPDETAP